MYPGERFNSITHLIGSVLALAGASVVITLAAQRGGATRITAVAIYGAMLFILYLSSTLYHSLRGKAKRVFHVFDHCSIYLLIAGTYTPFCLLALDGAWRITLLAIVWSGALLATAVKFAWVDAPKALGAAAAVVLGWVGIVTLPQLFGQIGVAPATLLIVGGALYTVGALVYALRRPNPNQLVFGYHEVFHALVVAAVACHYVGVTIYLA